MKLFSVPNGQVDHTDRAAWLTQPFDNPSAGVARFHLFEILATRRIAVFAGAARSADISGLLPEGFWSLVLMREDVYGNRSSLTEADAQIQVLVDSEGNVTTQLQGIDALEAEPIAGGYIRVRWALEQAQSWMRTPTQIQFAIESDPSTVLETIDFENEYAGTVTIGPFSHGQTVVPIARSKDSADSQDWFTGSHVTADNAAPAAPTLV